MSQLCFSFRFVSLRFIFPPILLCWHGADFHLISSPFFAFFAMKAKQPGIVKLAELPKNVSHGRHFLSRR